MLDTARPKILEVDGHVRLLGLYSPREDRRAKGLAILLHGWEGSADSTYLLTTGRTLHRAGYDVFRLNLRDHGDSHHLNKGIFLASRLTEVRQAVARAAELAQGKPVFLIGFSLGGNFALRIARAARRKPVAGLRRVVAVSPVLDPAGSTAAIDSIRLFRVYFMKKWKRSLIKKQALYPGLYDFGPVLAQDNVWAMSQAMIDMFGQFKDLGRYFRSYRLTGPDLGIHVEDIQYDSEAGRIKATLRLRQAVDLFPARVIVTDEAGRLRPAEVLVEAPRDGMAQCAVPWPPVAPGAVIRVTVQATGLDKRFDDPYNNSAALTMSRALRNHADVRNGSRAPAK